MYCVPRLYNYLCCRVGRLACKGYPTSYCSCSRPPPALAAAVAKGVKHANMLQPRKRKDCELISTAAAQCPSLSSRVHVCDHEAPVSCQQHCPAAHNTAGELQASIQGPERAAASEQLQSAWHNVEQCGDSSTYHKQPLQTSTIMKLTLFSQMCQILMRKIASMHASCHELPPMNHQPPSQLVPPHPVLQESPAAHLLLHPRPISSCTCSLQNCTVRLIVSMLLQQQLLLKLTLILLADASCSIQSSLITSLPWKQPQLKFLTAAVAAACWGLLLVLLLPAGVAAVATAPKAAGRCCTLRLVQQVR